MWKRNALKYLKHSSQDTFILFCCGVVDLFGTFWASFHAERDDSSYGRLVEAGRSWQPWDDAATFATSLAASGKIWALPQASKLRPTTLAPNLGQPRYGRCSTPDCLPGESLVQAPYPCLPSWVRPSWKFATTATIITTANEASLGRILDCALLSTATPPPATQSP